MVSDILELKQELLNRMNEIEGRQNYLIQKLGELHHHVTCLYGLTCNVGALPPAGGHLLLQQRACLRLGQMVDADLRAVGIPYFLSAGNLLGAMRTGGFIPWDDDFDFGLLRNDFNRAVKLLTQKYNHGPFRTTWAKSGGIFKVLFMNKICLDLFPWDIYHSRMETAEEIMQFKEDYNTAMDEARKFERGESEYHGYEHITQEMIMHGIGPNYINGDIFEGIDWMLFSERVMGHYHNSIWRHDYILPYGEIEFCGHKFMAPHNPDAWLTTRYGDWRDFRPEFSKHRGARFSYAELDILNEFIDGKIQ